MMKYKGYVARVEFDDEDLIFVGRVAGIRDIVTFHGTSVAELEQAFHEVVDDYLKACADLGQQPDKPFSGKMLIRVNADIHAAVAAAAESAGKSLNQWVGEVLKREAHG